MESWSDLPKRGRGRAFYLYLLWIPIQQLLLLGSSKFKAVYTILKTLQYILTVCPQAPTPPLPHIYSTKSMCTSVYSVYAIVCVCVCGYVCVAPQSLLFHKVFF